MRSFYNKILQFLVSKKEGGMGYCIKTNTTISLLAACFLMLVSIFSHTSISVYYYLAIIVFYCFYIAQQFLILRLGKTPSSFIMIYNVTIIIKLILCFTLLVFYYLFFSESTTSTEKIRFSLFFVSLYFIYLVVNTKNQFKNKQ